MDSFLQLVKSSKLIKEILKENKQISLAGVNNSQKSLLTAALFADVNKPLVIVVPDRDVLREFRREISVLLPDTDVQELFPDDLSTLTSHDKSLEIMASRITILHQLYSEKPFIVLLTVEAFCQKLPSPKELFASSINLSVGSIYDMSSFLHELIKGGYERADIVESPGYFCVRGGIVDIFAIDNVMPYRLEWLDDQVDSIRSFDFNTQRSLEQLDNIQISFLDTGEKLATDSIISFLPDKSWLFVDSPSKIKEALQVLPTNGFSWEQLKEQLSKKDKVLAMANFSDNELDFTKEIAVIAHSITPYQRQMELLANDLTKWLADKIQPIICLSNSSKAMAMLQMLKEYNVKCLLWEKSSDFQSGNVLIIVNNFSSGVHFQGEKWLLVSEQDIFGRMKKRLSTPKYKGDKIKYFSQIKQGDYVVHNVHGIGKYVGSKTMFVSGINRDYLEIIYAGDDKLYVPVDQVQLLNKYIGSDGHNVRLSKMGGADWLRVKTRAKAAITEMAAELLQMQAQRKLLNGHSFSEDTPWQREFEESFSFEETQDQLKAIEEIKSDMQKIYPMDRILCGDVGYGKTEVAARAAFKAVMDGKQVAILVPTTVLAQQHFLTFSDRMQNFGVSVDMVSRFRTAKEQREMLKKVAAGKVDILIGTHRLLQNDVSFKNLGLLIVDEEQRFGVAQKEKIKRWSKTIDILSLSATPIPRTLHMGLLNARDMSIIETPPEDRLPVETYVTHYDEDLVKEAISKEIRRGGFVYYVYNKVKDIDVVAANLQKMLPHLKIKVAHGQMSEDLLEAAMMDFYQGQFDILVSTTIIENGLDVPFANTIIIHNAQNFGLSQLYQMRGRVGRSNRLAFAYFLYPAKRVLSEIAQKRLQAIRDFTDLGAGFRIAMRDLEIRGAGNILGAQQHGHMLSVGFETYCQLLEQTMKELSEQPLDNENLPEPTIDINIDAFIPSDYIKDPGQKLDIYRRLSYIDDKNTMQDLLDEIIDRFSSPPDVVLNLLKIAMIKGICRKHGIKAIDLKSNDIKIVFEENSSVNPENIFNLTHAKNYKAIIKQGPPIMLVVKKLTKDMNYLQYIQRLLDFLVA